MRATLRRSVRSAPDPRELRGRQARVAPQSVHERSFLGKRRQAPIAAGQELSERDVAVAAQIGRKGAPLPEARPPQVVQDDLAALAVQLDVAAGRQEREAALDLFDAPVRGGVSSKRGAAGSKRNSRCCWPIRSITVR